MKQNLIKVLIIKALLYWFKKIILWLLQDIYVIDVSHLYVGSISNWFYLKVKHLWKKSFIVKIFNCIFFIELKESILLMFCRGGGDFYTIKHTNNLSGWNYYKKNTSRWENVWIKEEKVFEQNCTCLWY